MSEPYRSPAIPLSPSSPPETGLKRHPKRRLSDELPDSPASPPLMSVATKSYVPAYSSTQPSSGQAASANSPSPLRNATGSQDSTQRSATTMSSFSTASGSAQDPTKSTTAEDHDEHRNKRQRLQAEEPRQKAGEAPAATESITQGLQVTEEKEAWKLTGRNAHPTVRDTLGLDGDEMASDDTSLALLRKNMGDAFLLCKSTMPRSQPDPRQHLLGMFGLTDLIKSTARYDPLTHDKLKDNAIRSSYQGKVKDFKLAGINKEVKTEKQSGGKGWLRSMVEDIPDDVWQAEHVQTRIEASTEFRAKLRQAAHLQPGRVTDHEAWGRRLGHEKARTELSQPEPVMASSMKAAPVQRGVPAGRTNAQPSVERIGPRRKNTKRSYGDSSFSGYGGEWEDDDNDQDVGAYSDGDEEAGGPSKRKRRKTDQYG